MSGDKWARKRAALELQLARDSTNVDIASALWNHLHTYGHDIRSGPCAIEVFHDAAVHSDRGALLLAHALRELADDTGELPRAELFDSSLILALERAKQELSDDEAADIHWVSSFLSAE